MKNIVKRIYTSESKSAAWAITEYIWFPLLTFVTTPLLLSHLGAVQYGYWMLLTATTGLGGLFSGGNSAATIKMIATNHSHNEINDAAIINACTLLAVTGGAVLTVVILIVFNTFSEVLFPILTDKQSVFLTAVYASLIICMEQIDNIYASTLRALNKYGLNARIEIISRTLQIFVIVITTWLLNSINWIYFAIFIMSAIRVAIRGFILFKSNRMKMTKPSWKLVGEIIRTAKWGWIQGGTGLFYTVLDKFVITSAFGPAILAFYSISLQLATQIHAITASAFNIILPRIAQLTANNDNVNIQRTIRKSIFYNIVFSMTLALCVYIFGTLYIKHFILLEDKNAALAVFGLICGSFFLLSLNVSSYYILAGAGLIKRAAINSMYASIGLLLSFIVMSPINNLNQVVYARYAYAIIALLLLAEALNVKTFRKAT